MSLKRGVSFIEVIFAISILAGVLGTLILFMGNTHRLTKTSIHEIVASGLANEILEAVQSIPEKALSPIDGTTNSLEGDLVCDGQLQEHFYNLVFGKAASLGHVVAIPDFSAGWDCNLTISPIKVPSLVDSGVSDGVKLQTKTAETQMLITVRIVWKNYAAKRQLTLQTIRGRQ